MQPFLWLFYCNGNPGTAGCRFADQQLFFWENRLIQGFFTFVFLIRCYPVSFALIMRLFLLKSIRSVLRFTPSGLSDFIFRQTGVGKESHDFYRTTVIFTITPSPSPAPDFRVMHNDQ